ncbi:MAG: glycosyltransferase family 2 protein [Verrucomicrobia bacterium]|nr:glycosyltransferase family 2 protein [Verrucomicrobiota bacterium]
MSAPEATNPPPSRTPEVSVVIPVFNEAEGLPLLWTALSETLSRISVTWEVIFVDDGSSDGSWEILSGLRRTEPRVKALRLSRNFGHQIALTAGLEAATGAAVITMDADLQHPPSLVPELLRRWREGYDVVYTVRQDTADASAFKRLTSKVFYWIINRAGRIHIEPNAADFRLLDRKVVDALRLMPERRRFLRGLVSWMGYRQTALPYKAPPRAAGHTKYSIHRMARLAMDAVLSFSTLPLRMAFYLGSLLALASMIYLGYVLALVIFTDRAVPGWSSIIAVLLLFGSFQLVVLGLIGEYIARIYEETRQRPLYLVAERLDGHERPADNRPPSSL